MTKRSIRFEWILLRYRKFVSCGTEPSSQMATDALLYLLPHTYVQIAQTMHASAMKERMRTVSFGLIFTYVDIRKENKILKSYIAWTIMVRMKHVNTKLYLTHSVYLFFFIFFWKGWRFSASFLFTFLLLPLLLLFMFYWYRFWGAE